MHTLDIPEARARVFHNGDWSGSVTVLLGVNPIGHQEQDTAPDFEVQIPAEVFAAVFEKMTEDRAEMFEQRRAAAFGGGR